LSSLLEKERKQAERSSTAFRTSTAAAAES
jgi:hypothetical protein